VPRAIPAVYLAAGEGKRLRPLTAELPKAMIEIDGVPLAERALRSLRGAGVDRVVAVTGYRPEAFEPLGELITEQRHNERYAELENVYSLWMARDVVAGGCFVVNSDVLFEDEVAARLTGARGSAVLCASDHGVDAESMKAVARDGRLSRLTKQAPVAGNAEYIGLARIDPADGPRLAAILDELVSSGRTSVYYETAIEWLAAEVSVRLLPVDGLAWIEIDDHADLERAHRDVLERVA
jgi:choline kinase